MTQIKFNLSTIHYALENNLYVEYFTQCYLKTLNSSGIYDIDDIKSNYKNHSYSNRPSFKKYTFDKHLCDNVFFIIKDGRIFTKNNRKNKTEKTSFNFRCNLEELNFMAQKEATHSGKRIFGWNDTTIKYLFIAIWSCKYRTKKPYALRLISDDLNISISTIQKALKIFEVRKSHKVQEENSLRSFFPTNGRINLSPNYLDMPIGLFSTSKNKKRI